MDWNLIFTAVAALTGVVSLILVLANRIIKKVNLVADISSFPMVQKRRFPQGKTSVEIQEDRFLRYYAFRALLENKGSLKAKNIHLRIPSYSEVCVLDGENTTCYKDIKEVFVGDLNPDSSLEVEGWTHSRFVEQKDFTISHEEGKGKISFTPLAEGWTAHFAKRKPYYDGAFFTLTMFVILTLAVYLITLVESFF